MGEVPAELAVRTAPSNGDSDRVDPYLRLYDAFLETTTQMLATPKLNERLLLALEGIDNIFGLKQAAIAIINERDAELKIRAAVGFEGESTRVEMPIDSSAACVRAIHDAVPLWISLQEDEGSRTLFDKMHWRQDILALPLFGISEIGPKTARDVSGDSRPPAHYWTFDPGARLGVLYVGATENSLDPISLKLLKRFADRVGVIASLAIHQERLVNSVTKLQRERQWIESIMKSVADPIVLTDLDNEILLQNRRAEDLFSGSANAGEGKRRALKMNDLLFSAYLSSATVSSSEVIQRDITLVDPIEGSDIHFEVISTPAANSRGEPLGLVSIFRDVTDLREANEELARNFIKLQDAEAESRRERDRLDLIIENVGHPIVVCDSAGNFILFNRRAQLLFQENETFRSPAAAAVRANAVKLTSFISTLASASETGRQAEIELIDPEDGRSLPMEIAAREVLDPTGQVTAVVSILHDLTEIRELERRRVEQQLFESEKLAAVGRLAASIAHEVNNPLEAIKNALYLMQTNSEGDKNSRFLEIARKETERVSHIIRQMLGFARRPGEVDWVDVNQLLEETMVLLEKKMRQLRIRIVRRFDEELPKIRARADQLRQVFLNLIINAQQAIQGDGEMVISTFRYEQSLQPSIVVQISDSGVGIAEDDLNRIFDPFFSTGKKGTGLGLWVTQDIVRQHGGRIEVSSEIGRGTVFSIVLQVESPILEDLENESKQSPK
ncbi:MAG TPA: ATP-binding protein [Pyrinomonadaceae bacterium]|jgi:PAS domain S-box-containing protein|nr:ATP-binding protein [Pyrinomonadaceae bacterium]